MSAGTERICCVRTGKQTNSGGLGKWLAVVAGTNQNELAKAGANVGILGITLEIVTATDRPQQYCMACGCCVLPWTASASIGRLTGGVPTQIITAANGKCAKLPTAPGDYTVVGEMDNDSADASGDGDVVHVKLYGAPLTVTVPGS